MRSSIRTAVCLILALLLHGCGSVKLYSETRDTQGKAAAKAWSEVELQGFFNTERENLGKLLDAELASSARAETVAREAEIRVLAGTPVNRLGLLYDLKLLELVNADPLGSPPLTDAKLKLMSNQAGPAMRSADEAVKKWESPVGDITEAIDDLSNARYNMRRAQSFLQSLSAPVLSCERLLSGDPTERKEWEARNPEPAKVAAGFFSQLKTSCSAEKGARDTLKTAGKAFPAGALKDAHTSWLVSEQRLQDEEAKVAQAKERYDIAFKAYNDEVKRADPGKPVNERVKEKAAQAAAALSALESIGGPLGIEIASKERLDRINDLIGSLQSGEALDPATASKAEIVASMLPQIADKARAVAAASKGKALVPLLIQRDIEQANLNAARVQEAILRKRAALLEAIYRARAEQADTLYTARSYHHKVMVCDVADFGGQAKACAAGAKDRPMHDAWGQLPSRPRGTLLESTALYLDAFARQEKDINVMATQELALAQERNLRLSEVNAAMWSTLIGSTVNQSAEFAALGLKVDHFEKLLNILGIFYIGHGVNK